MLIISIGSILSGCGSYRIERHKRSPIFFNEQYVEGGVAREQTLEDGTILIIEPIGSQSSMGRSGENQREPFKIRKETQDGEIVLRCLIPEHVLMNLLNCLRREEYELIYDQLLSKETRERYEQQ